MFTPPLIYYSPIVEEAFDKFGKIVSLTLKRRYAFMTFENVEAAEKAVDEMNGHMFQGEEIKVEFAGRKRGGR